MARRIIIVSQLLIAVGAAMIWIASGVGLALFVAGFSCGVAACMLIS